MKTRFSRINFRTDTVDRFRSFSKMYGKTHSETLEGMLDFFQKYQLSPFQNFGATMHGMETNIKKRINGTTAILKDIEKSQDQTPPRRCCSSCSSRPPPRKNSPNCSWRRPRTRKMKKRCSVHRGPSGCREDRNSLERDLREQPGNGSRTLLLTKDNNSSGPLLEREGCHLEMTVAEYRKLREQLKKR